MPHQMVNFVKIFQHNFYLPQIETESEDESQAGVFRCGKQNFRKNISKIHIIRSCLICSLLDLSIGQEGGAFTKECHSITIVHRVPWP